MAETSPGTRLREVEKIKKERGELADALEGEEQAEEEWDKEVPFDIKDEVLRRESAAKKLKEERAKEKQEEDEKKEKEGQRG